MRNHSFNKKEQISPIHISRQHHSYLLLELLIALFLIGVCAIPVTQLPLKAMKEEINSLYRMQLHRLADLAFARFKENIYQQKISWKALTSSKHEKTQLFREDVEIALDTLGSRKFKQVGTVYSVGKKNKQGEEWRLVTFQVEFNPKDRQSQFFLKKKGSKRSHIFTYQILLLKTSHAI